ncbi:phage tail protein I [Vibrio fluvialis]|nr:hypothetical protein VPPG_00002 [Vibrio phage VD1]MBY8088272.1 phage tail protein I [Vibrio fluvialis]
MSLLPANATELELALEQVMTSDMSSPIRHLWNPLKCPSELLWVLAIVFQVDEWDEKWSEEDKRKTLLEAFLVHCIKGTPESIRRILRNAGYEEIEIVEGLTLQTRDGTRTRNGHFYHGWADSWAMYRIYLQRAITNQQAKQVTRLLNATAPLHCILAGLHYTEALFLHNGEIFRDGTYNRGAA